MKNFWFDETAPENFDELIPQLNISKKKGRWRTGRSVGFFI